MAKRTQADRDALTVEIGYAVFSGLFAAALVFGAVAGPALVFDLDDGPAGLLTGLGAVLATAVFLLRITHVLWRFGHRTGEEGG
ncbi:DUF6332 family protein [Streptomyces bambusae]|uniref:DUF6332 family protein n=1 Tax=Streptomyces bambusae TaxID=1550616 RepID=UPI001CFF41BE|nr:DUF6332 family protein [Streptomyces bambusae]MCB5166706.1 DUF6332 family protein [Streptomyces bambusae]